MFIPGVQGYIRFGISAQGSLPYPCSVGEVAKASSGVIRTEGRSYKRVNPGPLRLSQHGLEDLTVFMPCATLLWHWFLFLKVKPNKMFHLFRSGMPKLQVWHWAVGLRECLRGDVRVSPLVSHSCGLSRVERAGGTEGG